MLPYTSYEQKLLDLIRRQSITTTLGALQNSRLVLGGIRGSGGGEGGPIQPFVGKLRQTDVVYDTDEYAVFTIPSGADASLLDNLNRIRVGETILPSGGNWYPLNYTVPSGANLIAHLGAIDTALASIVAGSGGHTIQEEGGDVPQRTYLNFTGPTVVVADDAGNDATLVTISGETGGGGHTMQEEGTPLAQRTNLNFVGPTVVVTDDSGNDATLVTISGISSENPGLVEGRLTLTTATPVNIFNETAKTTVYFTPYKGNRISIYDGSSSWANYAFSERSVAVPSTTSKPFDIFAFVSSGTVALSTTDWSNDSARATALITQDGVYVKSGAPDYKYLGTGRTTGVSGQTENSSTNRLMFNYYHRLPAVMNIYNATSHTYTTTAYRAWNNDLTLRATFMIGVAEIIVRVVVGAQIEQDAGEGLGYASIAINSSTTNSLNNPISTVLTGVLNLVGMVSYATTFGDLYPSAGYHYIQAVEHGHATSPDFNRVEFVTTLL